MREKRKRSMTKKGHQKFVALKWIFVSKKGHSKIFSAKIIFRPFQTRHHVSPMIIFCRLHQYSEKPIIEIAYADKDTDYLEIFIVKTLVFGNTATFCNAYRHFSVCE